MPEPVETRADYLHWLRIPTRWMDNDVYGHVNNVTYYSYFDTVVNEHLVANGVLDPATSPVFGVVAETTCRFVEPLTFPEVVDAGLAVTKLGNSSVGYEIGLFREGQDSPVAVGTFVHVYVDRKSRRPRDVPEAVRDLLAPLFRG